MSAIVLDMLFISIICFMGVRILFLQNKIRGIRNYNRELLNRIDEDEEFYKKDGV